MQQPIKLSKKIFFDIPIKAESGLHIGGSNLSMAIGGADSVVIRDPLTSQPIIPGSSIKGKMRSLTEKLLHAYEEGNMGHVKYVPYQGSDGHKEKKVICDLYGVASKDSEQNIPSRLIVRDAQMDDTSVKDLQESDHTDMPFSEVKTEVVIDRVTSAAMPRQLERVPAGTIFNTTLVLNVFADDEEQKLVDYVKVGLRLMEDDYLGGNGSRGSGHVRIDWDNQQTTYKTLAEYESGESAKSYPSS